MSCPTLFLSPTCDSDGDSSGDDSVLIEREGFRDVVDEEVPPRMG